MVDRIVLDGDSFDAAALPASAREALDAFLFAQDRLREAEALQAALIRARNSYIAELRGEIVTARSGVDLAGLLDG